MRRWLVSHAAARQRVAVIRPCRGSSPIASTVTGNAAECHLLAGGAFSALWEKTGVLGWRLLSLKSGFVPAIGSDRVLAALTPKPDQPPCGGVPEWSKGADCKSAGKAFGGSNPPPTTTAFCLSNNLRCDPHFSGFRKGWRAAAGVPLPLLSEVGVNCDYPPAGESGVTSTCR